MLCFAVLTGLFWGPVQPILNLAMQVLTPEPMRGRVIGVITSTDVRRRPARVGARGPSGRRLRGACHLAGAGDHRAGRGVPDPAAADAAPARRPPGARACSRRPGLGPHPAPRSCGDRRAAGGERLRVRPVGDLTGRVTPRCGRLGTDELTNSRALGSVKFRAGGDSPRPAVTASDRLTRWNSWTDGESPDGKRTQVTAAVDRRGRARRARSAVAPESATGPRGRAMDAPARPSERAMRRALELAAHPRRTARAQPARRLRAARRRRRRRSPRASTAAPARRTPRSTRWPGPATAARGATAVVTLEPCNHTGRTGPCAQALRRRPAYAGSSSPSPTPTRSRPAAPRPLRAAGVEVESGLLARRGPGAQPGLDVRGRARPARSSPGSSPPPSTAAAPPPTAPAAGSPAPAARLDTHRLRARCDAMLVGTGTVAVDDPQLTVRDERRPAAARTSRCAR